MSCSTHLTLIPSFLDGTLAVGEAAALATHLVSCEGCRAALLTQRVPQHSLPVSGPEDPGFWGPMDAAILAELEVPRPAPARGPASWLNRRVETRRITLLAYTIALLSAVIWGWSRAPGQPVAPPITAAAPEQPAPIATPERPRALPAAYVPAHGSL